MQTLCDITTRKWIFLLLFVLSGLLVLQLHKVESKSRESTDQSSHGVKIRLVINLNSFTFNSVTSVWLVLKVVPSHIKKSLKYDIWAALCMQTLIFITSQISNSVTDAFRKLFISLSVPLETWHTMSFLKLHSRLLSSHLFTLAPLPSSLSAV